MDAFPFDGKNRYNVDELKQACKEIVQGKNTKKNLEIVRKNLYYLYIDGLCGHASKVGSPRFNDKTGLHEIPFVESRGIFGWISDLVEPIKNTGESFGRACALYVVVSKGHETFMEGANNRPNSWETLKKFAEKNSAPAPKAK